MSNKLFTRGYDTVRDKLTNNPHYNMSCSNCDYFYQAVGDKTECCQNNSVLEYDMVVTENRVYCLKWKQSKPKNSKLFRNKVGRDILD